MYLNNNVLTPAKSYEFKRQEIQYKADMENMFYMISYVENQSFDYIKMKLS